MAKLGVRVNIENGGLSQVSGWGFNSISELQDTLIAAGASGLSILGADDDNGADIDSYVSVPLGNYDSHNPKRIRRGYIEYETDGAITVKCLADEGSQSFTETLAAPSVSTEMGRGFQGRRSVHGVHWGFEIENVAGADFSIDYLGIRFVKLSRRRSLQ